MPTKLVSKVACLALAAAGAIVFVPAAQATPVNYDFTVDVTSGPLAGTAQNGSFSYDSSSVVKGGGYNSASGLLTAFNFMFNGTTYDASTANTGLLGFDAAGNLTSFFISSSCPLCAFAPGTDNFTVTPGMNGFLYSTSGIDSFEYGNVSFALAGASVPEPGALGVFGFGLVLLGGIAARRRFTLRRFEEPALG